MSKNFIFIFTRVLVYRYDIFCLKKHLTSTSIYVTYATQQASSVVLRGDRHIWITSLTFHSNKQAGAKVMIKQAGLLLLSPFEKGCARGLSFEPFRQFCVVVIGLDYSGDF